MPGQGDLTRNALRAATGVQAAVTGDGTLAGADKATLATATGTLNPGTYYFQLPTQGAQAVDVRLQGTHTTVVPTARLYATFADGHTVKGTAVSFAAFPGDATDWTASLTTLRGETYTMLEITVPATATLVLGVAEYSAL